MTWFVRLWKQNPNLSFTFKSMVETMVRRMNFNLLGDSMKKLLVLAFLLLAACGTRTQELVVNGVPGQDGYTTYITTQVVPPMADCGLAGGVKLVPYTDFNRNGALDSGEETVLAASTICNGQKGDVGLTGQTGATGETGAQGPQGVKGDTGEMGPIGPEGVQGIQGVVGAQGIAGPKGDQGLQGVQGIAGVDGINGQDGATGVVGAQGPKGEPGIQGIPGSSSQSGMTPVKLCANDTSAFPEYGFVIGSNLYAVYYGVVNGTLNAFMARLNPGNYVSTNSTNCTFSYTTDTSGNQYLDGNMIVPASRGLVAAVHNLPNWDNVTLPNLFIGNPTLGTFITQNLNVGDTQATSGFPGMPSSLQSLVGYDGYSLDINGYLEVPTTGDYTFSMMSDDGAILLIDGVAVITDDSLHAPHTATSGTVRLTKGLNFINVIYYQGPLSQIALQLKWQGPNLPQQVIPSSALSH